MSLSNQALAEAYGFGYYPKNELEQEVISEAYIKKLEKPFNQDVWFSRGRGDNRKKYAPQQAEGLYSKEILREVRKAAFEDSARWVSIDAARATNDEPGDDELVQSSDIDEIYNCRTSEDRKWAEAEEDGNSCFYDTQDIDAVFPSCRWEFSRNPQLAQNSVLQGETTQIINAYVAECGYDVRIVADAFLTCPLPAGKRRLSDRAVHLHIAKLLNVSEDTAARKVNSALLKLREALKGNGYGLQDFLPFETDFRHYSHGKTTKWPVSKESDTDSE
jgi:hypothetical protein